jgi:excisionase family DNA binding protein
MIKQAEGKVNRGVDNGMEIERKVLTVEELARELRISKNLAYRQVREGKIYSIKCGDRYLVPRRSLEELLNGQQRVAGSKDGSS